MVTRPCPSGCGTPSGDVLDTRLLADSSCYPSRGHLATTYCACQPGARPTHAHDARWMGALHKCCNVMLETRKLSLKGEAPFELQMLARTVVDVMDRDRTPHSMNICSQMSIDAKRFNHQ